MKHALRFLAVVLSAFVLASPASALEWTTRVVSAKAEPGADMVRTKFPFKNTSKTIVHILEVRTSCGCTDTFLNSSEVAPGESAALEVYFTVGKRTGPQEKEIIVLTDDSNVPVRLTLKVDLPAAPVAASEQKAR